MRGLSIPMKEIARPRMIFQSQILDSLQKAKIILLAAKGRRSQLIEVNWCIDFSVGKISFDSTFTENLLYLQIIDAEQAKGKQA